ncbi:uncharacterized protein LOC124943327 [Impatiens glandulifera]|uniref:uncharacterized protein LOC124943327 n=1 Tax=Impatiens glandulifera TaxID=253017 RepID=UPI001FB0C776|nr:uncharacterized protein LOC124943327 [Impatiens glandulifera]
MIEDLELVDLPLKGGRFTFRRGNGSGGLSQSRIDMFLIKRRVVELLFRHFRLENKWLSRVEFLPRVQEWWRTQAPLGSASSKLFMNLKNLRKQIKSWYVGERATFFAKVGELCKKINIIDKVEEVRELLVEEVSSHIFLVSNLLELCKELKIGTRQRSRATWLRYRDKNTKFFYCVSKAQTRNNAINSISVEGVVHDGEPAISNSIVEFYKELFKESHMDRPKLDGVNLNTINAEQKSLLEARFTEEEVEAAVMGCGSDKAPRSDGFTLALFKKLGLFSRLISWQRSSIFINFLHSTRVGIHP